MSNNNTVTNGTSHYSTDTDAAEYPWSIQYREPRLGLWIPAEEEATEATGFQRGHKRYATHEDADIRLEEMLAVDAHIHGTCMRERYRIVGARR